MASLQFDWIGIYQIFFLYVVNQPNPKPVKLDTSRTVTLNHT